MAKNTHTNLVDIQKATQNALLLRQILLRQEESSDLATSSLNKTASSRVIDGLIPTPPVDNEEAILGDRRRISFSDRR